MVVTSSPKRFESIAQSFVSGWPDDTVFPPSLFVGKVAWSSRVPHPGRESLSNVIPLSQTRGVPRSSNPFLWWDPPIPGDGVQVSPSPFSPRVSWLLPGYSQYVYRSFLLIYQSQQTLGFTILPFFLPFFCTSCGVGSTRTPQFLLRGETPSEILSSVLPFLLPPTVENSCGTESR